LGEEWRLLRAAHRKRLTFRRCSLEPLDFCPAQVVRNLYPDLPAAAPDGLDVERHRTFARANQDFTGALRHLLQLP
jgi:hypothetical protein